MIPISDISYYWYCPREFINFLYGEKKFWQQNIDFTQSRILHDKIHQSGTRYKKGIKQLKNIEIYSEALQLSGKVDLIEISAEGTYPVEYKKGAKRLYPNIETQVKIQALVLEEMLATEINYGYLSFSQPHERLKVELAAEQKATLKKEILAIQEKLQHKDFIRYFPRAEDHRCDKCSFARVCY